MNAIFGKSYAHSYHRSIRIATRIKLSVLLALWEFGVAYPDNDRLLPDTLNPVGWCPTRAYIMQCCVVIETILHHSQYAAFTANMHISIYIYI
jgi:hypothetical protein